MDVQLEEANSVKDREVRIVTYIHTDWVPTDHKKKQKQKGIFFKFAIL